MAADAIPPPLFFGRSLAFSSIGSGNRHARERSETPAAAITPLRRPTRLSASKTQAITAKGI
jgi:hypothetical protein